MQNPTYFRCLRLSFVGVVLALVFEVPSGKALAVEFPGPVCLHKADCAGEPRIPEYFDVQRSASSPPGKASIDIIVNRQELPGAVELTVVEPGGVSFSGGQARIAVTSSPLKTMHREQLLIDIDAGRATPQSVIVRLTVLGSQREPAMVIDRKVELLPALKSTAASRRVPVLMPSTDGRSTVQYLPPDQAADLVGKGLAAYGNQTPIPGKAVNASPEGNSEVAQ